MDKRLMIEQINELLGKTFVGIVPPAPEHINQIAGDIVDYNNARGEADHIRVQHGVAPYSFGLFLLVSFKTPDGQIKNVPVPYDIHDYRQRANQGQYELFINVISETY